jgi:hypothetical protein
VVDLVKGVDVLERAVISLIETLDVWIRRWYRLDSWVPEMELGMPPAPRRATERAFAPASTLAELSPMSA